MPSAAQRIAQSGFHCSLVHPPVTGVVTRSFVSGSSYVMVPALASCATTGTCSTMPVRGQIGRNGE